MFVPFEFNSLFDACRRLFKGQLDKTANVAAAPRTLTPSASSTAAEQVAEPEHVSKRFKNIVYVVELPCSAAHSSVHAGVTVLVVSSALFRIV